MKIISAILALGFLFGNNGAPKVGDKAPDFQLPDQDGKVHRLSDYLGRNLVVYFYPKDDTPG